MKTQSLRLLVLVGLCWAPTIGHGSEVRVDSMGGLASVVTDETTDLDLFLDGNPAGLVLLPQHDRFDLSGQWLYSDSRPLGVASLQQTFSTLPRLSEPNPIKYEGLMVSLEPHWTLQVAGDFLNPQDLSQYSADSYRYQEFRGLVRSAYNLGPFSLGVEADGYEIDHSSDPGLFNTYVGITSGASTQNYIMLKTGIVTTFPENNPKDDPYWQVGGYFATQVGPNVDNESLTVFYYGGNPFTVSQSNTTQNNRTWGSEVYYEVPNLLKLRFSTVFNSYDNIFQRSVPFASTYFTNLAPYQSFQYQTMTLTGACRFQSPLSDKENFKLGGSLQTYFNNQDSLHPAGDVYITQNKQQITSVLGVGIESLQNYTLGLQFKTQNYIQGNQSLVGGGSLTDTDFDYYQLALGGERWLSPSFAFRLGLIEELDNYYSASSSQVLNSAIATGLGFQQEKFLIDLKLTLGQASTLGNSSISTTMVSVQVGTTLFL